MRGEWCYLKNFLNDDECIQIINSLKNENMDFGKVGVIQNENRQSQLNLMHRKSKILWLDKQKYKNLYNKLWILAIQANREFFGFHIDDVENLQFTEYSSDYEGHFGEHVDISEGWVLDSENKHRKISCSIQLSDPRDYSGGELLLKAHQIPDKTEIIQRGTAIFFPSFLRHEVTPVTKGVRYSLIAWFKGPAFR